MEFGNLFYHGMSVGVGSHNQPELSHVSSSQNEGGAQQKLGLILYPKKGFLGGQIPSFPPFPPFPLTLKAHGNFHFPPFTESTWQLPISPIPLFIDSTWQLLFPPPPPPHDPQTLKAHGNMLSSP
jgi:hypothetical protein